MCPSSCTQPQQQATSHQGMFKTGCLPAQGDSSCTCQPFLHGMGLVQAGHLLLHWLGDTTLSYPIFSFLWHCYPMLALPSCHSKGLENISASQQLQTQQPQSHPQQLGAIPRAFLRSKLCFDSAGVEQEKKGWISVILFIPPLANIFLPLRLATMLLMMPWTPYIESIKIHISDFLPLKKEDLLHTIVNLCPKR